MKLIVAITGASGVQYAISLLEFLKKKKIEVHLIISEWAKELIKEETGLDAKIIRRGTLFELEDKKKRKRWIVTPFLCKVNSQKIKLDHENTESVWIDFKDIKKYDTVPGLKKDLKILGLE